MFLKCTCFCYRLLSCVIDCEHLLFWMMSIFSQYSSVHMRMHFATTLQTSTLEAHANHNGSEPYGTYRQQDSAFTALCAIMKTDRPEIHCLSGSSPLQFSPWSVLPWRWKLYSPMKHQHLCSHVGRLCFL